MLSPTLAVYSLLPSRARYVITSLIGEKPQGIVVSDRYAGYAHIPAAQRQVCWSHLIRDFIRISERAGLPGRIGANLLGSAYVLFRWRTAAKPAPNSSRCSAESNAPCGKAAIRRLACARPPPARTC